MSKQGYLFNKGINDMPRGWRKDNIREYQLWQSILCRCYYEKYHKKYPTYKDCYVCEKWLKLSGFIDDLPKIDGYELWKNNPNKRIALDKDIKSNGKNKCYCLVECVFITNEENAKQARKTDSDETKELRRIKIKEGLNFSIETRFKISELKTSGAIGLCDKDGNLIKPYRNAPEAEKELKSVRRSNIIKCCKGQCKSTGKDNDGNKMYWKYIKDIDYNIIANYIINNIQIKIKS